MKPLQVVGMDLGTTFSAVAVVGENGQARAIPNAEGMLTTPSVALWYENAFLVGQPALDMVYQASGSRREQLDAALIRAVKRMISEPPSGGLSSNGHLTTPVEVSAAILAKLARDASAHLGFSVRDTVITVPAHFGDRERNATRKAAEMAGLQVQQIMNEPSAAALTYTHHQSVKPGTALVFDLGGGTFDATVLQIEERESRVLATQGIEEMGGINFTNALAAFLRRSYQQQTGMPYPDDLSATDTLIVEAERAKCSLSEQEEVIVSLAPASQPAARLRVTRKQFENEIDFYLFDLQVAVEQALDRAHKTPDQIDRVLLCGGSSRIPAVQRMLANLFARPPERTIDLDLSVALGAAYQAWNRAQLHQYPGLQVMPGGLVIDSASYAVGIAALAPRGDRLVKLIMLHQGEALDTWSPPFQVRIMGAAADFPPIAVYKGEGEEPDSSDYLGDITLALPPGTQPGTRASVRMLQDQSGLIQVQLTIGDKALPGTLHRV